MKMNPLSIYLNGLRADLQYMQNSKNPGALKALRGTWFTAKTAFGLPAAFIAMQVLPKVAADRVQVDLATLRSKAPAVAKMWATAELAVEAPVALFDFENACGGGGGGGNAVGPAPATFALVPSDLETNYGIDGLAGHEMTLSVATNYNVTSASIEVTRGDNSKQTINGTVTSSGGNAVLKFQLPDDTQRSNATNVSITAANSSGNSVTTKPGDITVKIAGKSTSVTVNSAPSGDVKVGFDTAAISITLDNADGIKTTRIYAGGQEVPLTKGTLDSNGKAPFTGSFVPVNGGVTDLFYTEEDAFGTVSDAIPLGRSFTGVQGGTTQGVTWITSGTDPNTPYAGKGTLSALKLYPISYANNVATVQIRGSGSTLQTLTFTVSTGVGASAQTRPISADVLTESGITGSAALKITPGIPGLSELNAEWFAQ